MNDRTADSSALAAPAIAVKAFSLRVSGSLPTAFSNSPTIS